MRVLTLIGLMGAGKSTVGRLLARRLSWAAVDLDVAIEERAGMTIPTIFDTLGESTFRSLEDEVMRELLDRERLVIATGGGAPCRPGAMDAILAAGPAAWLDASSEVLAERALADGTRPLLAGMDRTAAATFLDRQRADREPHYRRATATFDVSGRSAQAVAEAVIEALGRSAEVDPAVTGGGLA